MMASAAAPTANLLQTCAALLMSPYCGMHSPNIEVVLVKIGLQSTKIGLKLIDILLRNCAASGSDPTGDNFWYFNFYVSSVTNLHCNITNLCNVIFEINFAIKFLWFNYVLIYLDEIYRITFNEYLKN